MCLKLTGNTGNERLAEIVQSSVALNVGQVSLGLVTDASVCLRKTTEARGIDLRARHVDRVSNQAFGKKPVFGKKPPQTFQELLIGLETCVSLSLCRFLKQLRIDNRLKRIV